jgi:hypothetical protein
MRIWRVKLAMCIGIKDGELGRNLRGGLGYSRKVLTSLFADENRELFLSHLDPPGTPLTSPLLSTVSGGPF